MLTAVVALVLALGAAGAAGAPAVAPGVSGPPEPDIGSESPISVTMTTQNDGHAVSLLDQAHPGYAHPELGTLQNVLVTVQLNGIAVHEWDSHLETPDAFQGITPPDCRGDEEVPPVQVSCLYRVQTVEGLNTLGFRFSADGGRVTAYTVGFLMGGTLGWSAGWEVLDATGQWSAVTHDQAIELPATLSSALRYVVTNSGGIPFRLANACSTRLIAPREQLRCPVRGVRPAQSLAGDYQRQLQLHDVDGRDGEVDFQTTVRAFAGVFTFEQPSAIVGQRVVMQATGLPRGSSFAMQFRLNDEWHNVTVQGFYPVCHGEDTYPALTKRLKDYLS